MVCIHWEKSSENFGSFLYVSQHFPIFFSFYLGAWADLFGRKPLFYLVLTGYFLQQCVYVVCAYYFESKKEYLLLSHVPTSLSGGWAVWMMAMNAFIADITKPEDRAFRYGMLHIVHSLGRPLGAPFGGLWGSILGSLGRLLVPRGVLLVPLWIHLGMSWSNLHATHYITRYIKNYITHHATLHTTISPKAPARED